MLGPVETGVFDFAGDLHAEARTVLGRTPHPQNAFEVAVVLETEGYDQQTVRDLGSSDIFDLARRVWQVLDLYTMATPATVTPPLARADEQAGPRRITVALLARCLVYTLPWLVAVIALAVSRVSFWSTITTRPISSAISLALFVALIVTGAFVQAFSRRGMFYALQCNRPLFAWATRWSLGGAAVATTALYLGLYVLLQYGVTAYPPVATRLFLWFGLSITAMLLSLAPLYIARNYVGLALATGGGAVFVAVAGRAITTGDYINPYTAAHVQLVAIWIVVVVAVAADLRVLSTAAGYVEGPDKKGVRPPRLSVAGRSVAGYAAYGACFFTLIIVDHLVVGGLWRGRFVYNGHYELAAGAALLVLVPTMTYVAAAGEVFARSARDALANLALADVGVLRTAMLRFYRRHLGVLVAVGLASAAVLLLLGSQESSLTTLTATLPSVYRLFAGAVGAYLLLAVGSLNTSLLFSLGRPTAPAATTALGTAISLLVGGLLAAFWRPEAGALVGLLAGTAVFAAGTTIAAAGAFARFDTVYYQAF